MVGAAGLVTVNVIVLAAVLIRPHLETVFTARVPPVNPNVYSTATHELSDAAATIEAWPVVAVSVQL